MVDDIPPPIKNFKDMKFPRPVVDTLKEKGIVQPTPIQVQGVPVILAGRDMIGIAFTGSGKTLVFVLPMIMIALQEEMMMPIAAGEGPIGLIVCPSRELARQTYEVVEQFVAPLVQAGYPPLRSLLCIGGIDMRSQLEVVKRGVHIVVATPERLIPTAASEHGETDGDNNRNDGVDNSDCEDNANDVTETEGMTQKIDSTAEVDKDGTATRNQTEEIIPTAASEMQGDEEHLSKRGGDEMGVRLLQDVEVLHKNKWKKRKGASNP